MQLFADQVEYDQEQNDAAEEPYDAEAESEAEEEHQEDQEEESDPELSHQYDRIVSGLLRKLTSFDIPADSEAAPELTQLLNNELEQVQVMLEAM